MQNRKRRVLIVLFGLMLLLQPACSQAASRALPIPGDFSMILSGDGNTAYVAAMDGALFRYRVGEDKVERMPLLTEFDERTSSLLHMCVIDGGVYYLYYDSSVLHLMYAEKEGLPGTITIPVKDVKGGYAGSYMRHLVYDGTALWLMMDARQNDTYVLCRFDLKQGRMKAFDESRGSYGFALLPEGRVALGFSLYEKEKVFGRLAVLDTATGKLSQQVDIPVRPEAMAWDAARCAVLYLSDSKLWAWPLSGQPQELRKTPVSGNGWANPGILMEGGLLNLHMQGLFLADPAATGQGSLHIIGESPGFAYAGIYDRYMNLRPDVDLSFQSQIDQNQTVNTGELGQRIQTGMLPFDVMLLNTQTHDLPALIKKGYCLDLSGEADLVAAVSAMHPAIRDAVMVDGRLYAIPLRVDGMNMFQYSEQSLSEAGMTRDDLPTNFERLIEWVGNWPRSLGDEIKPLEGTKTAAAMKEYFLTRFMHDQYKRQGHLDFMDPVFVDLLNRIDSQRLPTYPEQMPSVLHTGGSELMGEDVVVLSLTEGGTPVQAARLFLYFINSQTENKELALDYVRTAIQHTQPEHKAALYPGWTEAVERDGYAAWVEEMGKEEALLREAVQATGADTASGRSVRERLDAHLARVAQQQAFQQYQVSPGELAFYQQKVAPYLFFPPVNPFTNYYEPGGEGIYNELRRFTQGQQDAQAFAQSMDQKARLMQMEEGE